MVLVPAGEIVKGSPFGEISRFQDEGPQHRVRISRPLAVGRYEVTFAEWDACVAAGGCRHQPNNRAWGRGRQPVINITWNDAHEYLAWLSKMTGVPYRLLSEAEWEYAARAGNQSAYPWGETPGTSQANFNGSGSQWSNKQTAPVGSFAPNRFGLHDMIGNVWEWVEDCWHDNYTSAPTDGSVWLGRSCGRRVARGGSWSSGQESARAAVRSWYYANKRFDDVGFRIARTLTP